MFVLEKPKINHILGLPSLCMKDSHHYGTEFNFLYQTFKSDGLTSEENIILKIGENNLVVSKGKVSLTMLYTRWNGICYKINTTREVDLKKTEIKLSRTVERKLLEKII